MTYIARHLESDIKARLFFRQGDNRVRSAAVWKNNHAAAHHRRMVK